MFVESEIMVIFLLFNLFITTFTQPYNNHTYPGNCTGLHEYKYDNISCFKLFTDQRTTLSTAEDICHNWSSQRGYGYVSSIHSQDEHEYFSNIWENMNDTDIDNYGFWIGLYNDVDNGNVYRWSDGTTVDYINKNIHDFVGVDYFCIRYTNYQYPNSTIFDWIWKNTGGVQVHYPFCREYYTLCDGFYSNDAINVCNGVGWCIEDGLCQCHNNTYIGQFCEIKTCNGKDILCKYRGTCNTDTGICNCLTEYTGNDCQYPICNDISSNNPSVCSNHGNCVSPDTCDCDSKWTGKYCQFPKCDINICGSHGECIYNDTCLCDVRYAGLLCDQFNCYGIASDNDTTCSNHGSCLGFNYCDCLKNWQGEKCEVESNSFIFYIIGSVAGGFFLLLCLIGIPLFILYFKYKKKAKTFDKIKDVEIVLAEQQIESKKSDIMHFQFKKSLFTIDYDDIKLEEVLYPEQGGSATLYRATFSGTDCCVKIFKTGLICSDEEDYKEIERELSIVSSVRNPNLDKSRIGIVFELCEGNLADMMLKNNYSVKQKIKMLHQISLGMKYLHERNIIHRDLKLQNILVDKLGVIKITDFGLSKLVTDKNQLNTRRVGTSYYLAPEVFASSKYDEKCDVYSFGIVTFCLFERTIQPYKSLNIDNNTIETKVFTDSNFRPVPSKPSKDKFPKEILSLMKKSWHSVSKQRPSFESIERDLRKMI